MSGFFWARKYLFKQKRRTFLTVFGIALAIALVCGTGVLANSFRMMMVETAIMTNGNWHYDVKDISDRALADTLVANRAFADGAVYSNDVFASFEGAYNEAEPELYLQLFQGASDYVDMTNLKTSLVAGRLPETPDELAMSTNARRSFKETPSLGDTLTLPVGQLEVTDSSDPSGYQFTQTGTRTFTVVGFYDGNYADYGLAYHSYTLPDDGQHSWIARVKLHGTLDYDATLDNAIIQAGIDPSQLSIVSNTSLLLYDAQGLDSASQSALITTCGLLMLIILVMMGLVVRNTFAISVDEKLQQYGTLRCLGANRRMIRAMVRSEALLMWLMAVPIGVGGALAAMQILFMVIHSLGSDALKMLKLCWAVWPFALSLGVSLVCVLIAASSPARICAKVSPVGALRGEGTLRNAVKSVHGGGILRHAFGLPGLMSARNMHRNPRKYRATLLSVAGSIALFMLMSGFASGMRDSMHLYSGMDGMDVYINTPQADNVEQIGDTLSQLDDVDKLAGYSTYHGAVEIPADKLNAEYEQLSRQYGLDDGTVVVYGINRDEYEALNFEGRAPSYEEFCQPGTAVLCQQLVISSSRTGIKVIAMSDFASGDALDIMLGGSEQTINIAGTLRAMPWYTQVSGTLVMFMAEQNMTLPYDIYNYALLAKPNMQQQLSDEVGELEYTADFVNWSISYIYEMMSENRAVMQMMDIFLYGFTTVIILICSMNLLNTIKTNISSRRREMSMLRAIGMSKRQMVKMLALECIWYAVLGTALGLVIGVPLELMLIASMSGLLTMQFSTGLMLIQSVACLASTCLIALAAGYGPIREIVNRPATEGIRAIE